MIQRWFRFLAGIIGICVLFAGLCLAQNSEVDGPQQEWIYHELEVLYEEGYLQNYPKEWVRSGNKLSRFEIAYYIKQILTVKLKDNNQSPLPRFIANSLQKLIIEFRNEIEALGIKITDINKISPNLDGPKINPEEYQDLDIIIKGSKKESKSSKQEPCYYFGQYFQSFQRKSFLFIPMIFVNPSDLSLLENTVNNINIVSSNQLGTERSFLVIQGDLPVQDGTSMKGYYLFPVGENSGLGSNLLNSDNSVLSLLDQVNQIQQVEYLWRFDGILSLAGYFRKESNLHSEVFLGNINKGLKVGGLLLFSQNSSTKPSFETIDFGLPFYEIAKAQSSTAVDLDTITGSSLESLLINVHGSMALNSQTSIYGGLDFLYRKSESSALFESFWPSDTKASAGVSYQMNGYWKLLTYQSFVNSQVKTGVLSTTSVGVEYDDWVTFWLAYQLLDFDDPVLTGAFTFRF